MVLGERLVGANHYAAEDIKVQSAEVKGQWDSLMALVEEREALFSLTISFFDRQQKVSTHTHTHSLYTSHIFQLNTSHSLHTSHMLPVHTSHSFHSSLTILRNGQMYAIQKTHPLPSSQQRRQSLLTKN